MATLRPGKEEANPCRQRLPECGQWRSVSAVSSDHFVHSCTFGSRVQWATRSVTLQLIEHLLAAEEPVVTLCIWALLSEHWGLAGGRCPVGTFQSLGK